MRFSATLLFIALLITSASAAPRERRPGGNGGPARGGNRNRPAPPAPPAVGGGAPPPPPPPPGNGNGNGGGGGGGGNRFTGGTGDASQINTAVIPASFGITAGQGPQANGCTGANNAVIPCDCPPAPNDPQFLGGLASLLTQGFFPDPSVPSPIDLQRFNDAADRSAATNRDRATAMIQVMQSLSGTKGQGCPGVATPVLVAQQRTGVVG